MSGDDHCGDRLKTPDVRKGQTDGSVERFRLGTVPKSRRRYHRRRLHCVTDRTAPFARDKALRSQKLNAFGARKNTTRSEPNQYQALHALVNMRERPSWRAST